MRIKVLDGWLKDDLARAAARVREWEAKPIVQAQIRRAAEVAAKK